MLKHKPDYEGFCKHLAEWDNHGIAYSLRDQCELAFKYCCPIFKNVLLNNCRRDDIVHRLVNKWRKAENYYLETGNDNYKQKLLIIQHRLNLNQYELDLLYKECNSIGI